MKTDFLFTQPSFRSGFASVIDIEGKVFYNDSENERVADCRALRSDWEMVGKDLRKAIDNYARG